MGITGLWRENESVDVPSGVAADGGDGGVGDTPTPRDVLDQGFMQGLTAAIEGVRGAEARLDDVDCVLDCQDDRLDFIEAEMSSKSDLDSARNEKIRRRLYDLEQKVVASGGDVGLLLEMMADLEKQNRILEMRVQYIAGENLALHRQQDCMEDDYLSKFREANNRIAKTNEQIEKMDSVVYTLFVISIVFTLAGMMVALFHL
jgi:hypothetical protein